MQFTFTFSASAEDVFPHLTDPQIILDRCTALGSLEADCDSDGEVLPTVTIRRVEEAELPSMMKKVLGDQQELNTVQSWSETDESYDCTSTTSIQGAPITISSTQSLYNLDKGSEIEVELTVKAKVPFLGKKIEPMVASKVRSELIKEFKYLEQNL